MKSYKDLVNEVLTKMTPLSTWIDDFVHSKNAKFAGKSTAERIAMAKGAYYAKQRRESVEEAVAVSQNSTAITDMNEDHLVHVNDGSKYDDKPHPDDVKHIMAGVKQHGGEHAGASDKGVFFKFKSKENAHAFKSHVNKCPNRSCDADLSEAVEYKGIGTDVVDKKKKLNPQPNFTTDKKTVKDFKEAKELDKACWKGYKAIGLKNKNGRQVPNCVPEEVEEGKVYDPFTKKMVNTKPIKVQAGGGATRNGVPVETGPSKHKQSLKNEGIELIAKHEVKADAPHKSGGHVILTKSSNKWHVLHNKKSSPEAKDLHRSKLLHSYADEKEARAKFKELHEEQIDELSIKTMKSAGDKLADKALEFHYDDNKHYARVYAGKALKVRRGLERRKHLASKGKYNLESVQIDEISKSTLMRYIPKASRDVGSHTYAGKEAGEWANHYTRAGDWAAAEKHSKKSYADFKKANKRIAGIDTATKKLGTQKEETEHLDEEIKGSNWTGSHLEGRNTKHANKEIDSITAHKKKAEEAKKKGDMHAYHDHMFDHHDEATYFHKHADESDHYTDPAEHGTHAGHDRAMEYHRLKLKRLAKHVKEEVEHIEEATVSSRKYDWGTMKTVNHGKSFSIPLHPEHHEPIAKLKHGESHSFKDETGRKWKATREHDTVHFHGGSYGTQKTSVPHSKLTEAYTDKEYQSAIAAYLKKGGKVETLPSRKPRPGEKTFINRTGSIWKKGYTKSAVSGFNNKSQTTVDDRNKHIREETVEESRGHKVLATFFKNREVAQRAFQGNPTKDAEVAQGGGTPADQGIAAAKKDAEDKKVNEAMTPSVQAPAPKKTKSTAKEYNKAPIPGTKRIARSKPDSNEPGEIKEDQYTSEYKIKYYVDPVTGENKTRKIRPHRVNFKASKMRGEPAQLDAQGDYGMKESYVTEGGFDNYHEIAKELVKRHGKNVDTGHINDLAGERDTHRGLDHSEVMHHVKKILSSKEVKEGDEYDEMWKEYKGKTFKKESYMLKFNDYLKEAALSAKQKKIAAIAGDKDKIDAHDLAALRAGKKPVEEAKDGWSDNDSLAKPITSNQAMADHSKYFNKVTKLDPKTGEPVKKPVEEASCSDKDMKKEELVGNQHKLDKNKNGKLDAQDFKMLRKEETEQIDEISKKTLGSYVNKAAKDSRYSGQIATDFENQADKARKQSKKDSFERLHRKYLEKSWKREDGIAKAVNKLTKEEVQIDEGKMKDIYTDMMDHATKKGYSSHKEFTSADYDTVGKQHGISGKELAVIAGHKTAHQANTQFKKPVQPGKEMERARALAQRGMQSLSKEEVEAIEGKLAQLGEGNYKHEVQKSFPASGVKTGASAPKGTSTMPKDKNKAKGKPAGSIGEEVEQESSPYLKATLAVMDEGKIDDLRDAQKLRKDTQSAYDKNFKQDTSHPHITLNKGTAYGGANQKDDENDEKPEATEKKGRGRPAGSKSGARLKGGGHEDGGIPVHNLHLPKSYK